MQKKMNHPILTPIIKSFVQLPTPSSLSYSWNWGSTLGMVLVLQLVTGILLSMHYAPEVSLAFPSVLSMTQDSNEGWILRMLHMNGASLFFVFIYMHILKAMNLNSYKIKETWMSGITIFLGLMITAFLGYVLPWGQMSFWGTSVITNFLSVLPILGKTIVKWVWGGFSVSNPTLNRFFSLHFLLPLAISMLIVIHLISLHATGSSNPISIPFNLEKIPFHPFFSFKDLLSILVIFLLFLKICILSPLYLGDPENFNLANPLISPPHIQPEWYFLFAYAILRSIPNKMGGVIALALSIIILYPMMILPKINKTKKHSLMKLTALCNFSMIFVILTWIGANPVEPPFILTGQISSFLYFFWMMTI